MSNTFKLKKGRLRLSIPFSGAVITESSSDELVWSYLNNKDITKEGGGGWHYHDKPDYVYLIGADKISEELHYVSEAVNKTYSNLELDYRYNNDKDPNRFYYRSDHYNFAKKGIPVIFYFTGVHEDYHKPTDDIEKILFPKLARITKLVFYTAWEIANKEERLKITTTEKE